MKRIARILLLAKQLSGIKDPRDIFSELKGKDMVFFDVETTGLRQHEHQITQIAAIRVRGEDLQSVDKFHKKIALTNKTQEQILKDKSKNDKEWTVSDSLKYTQYDNLKMPVTEENKSLEEFKAFCESSSAYLIAHNASFDLKMIGTRIGKIKSIGVHDTMMFARLFYIPALKALAAAGDEKAKITSAAMTSKSGKVSSALNAIAKGLGIDTSNAHTAMADVENTVKIFSEMTNYIEEKAEEFLSSDEYEQERQNAILKQREYDK